MPVPSTFRHVFFDLFGTLVTYDADFTRQEYEVTAAMACGWGIADDHDDFVRRLAVAFDQLERIAQRSCREYSMHDAVNRYLQIRGASLEQHHVDDLVTTYLEEWTTHIDAVPGAAELLARVAREATIAIITNTHHAPMVHELLGRTGMARHLSGVFTSVEFGFRKPHASLFRHAATRLGADPARTVYIGDSETADYHGALDAGFSARLIDPEALAAIPEAHRLARLTDFRG